LGRVPRLLHRWFNHDLRAVAIILSNLIALIATRIHLIIPSNLLIDAILKLV
jgi:hypothetical protein